MDDDEVNEWHDAETVIRPASNDGVSAQSQTQAVDGLDSNALDPWAEEQRPDTISAQSTVISLETEVVPLVFAGESEILDCADAWGGSSEFPPVSSSQQDGSQIQAIDSSNSGLGPVLGEPANAQVFWKTISGKYVPAEAIPIGRDSDGAPLFAARALFKGGIHVGKARNGAACHIPFGGKEIQLSESDPYDVLCGNPGAVEWVPTNDKVSGSLVTTGRLIEGGREADGGLLFVGVCDTYFHGSQVGKCGPNLVGLHYSYGGKEIRVSHYRVALHCSPNEIDDLSFPGERAGERAGTIYWRAASVQHGVPAGAIRMGRDSDGAPLYAGRAKVVKGGIQVGKVRLDAGCYVGFGGKELRFKKDFEVLCGDSNLISLVEMEGAIGLGKLADLKPVEAGHEENGMPLYISIHEAFNSIQIGKCSPTLPGCHFSYQGKECVGKKYRMIVFSV